jgi:hypothetical protein
VRTGSKKQSGKIGLVNGLIHQWIQTLNGLSGGGGTMGGTTCSEEVRCWGCDFGGSILALSPSC